MRCGKTGELFGCITAVGFLAFVLPALAQVPQFGVGFRAGAARLDGDVTISTLSPEVNGVLSFALRPHLRLSGEIGFADLQLDAQQDTAVLRVVPFALNLTFRFAPYSKATPFVALGGGASSWQHRSKRTHKAISLPGVGESEVDYFFQTAGGLEVALSPRLAWTIGASYRYGLTDNWDANSYGDKNDAIISAFTGLTVNIGKVRNDADLDGVIDRYDLNSKAPEDRDGYLDHDGMPDKRMSGSIASYVNAAESDGDDKVPPIVLHNPVSHATVGSKLRLRAEIFENQNLRKAAILYRPANSRQWSVAPLDSVNGSLYAGVIPGTAVQRLGLEYCVVAVDAAISGVGYSGVPDRPNFVRVHGKETAWRIVTGLAAAAGWGAASYLVFSK
jgi:hypothetical protein